MYNDRIMPRFRPLGEVDSAPVGEVAALLDDVFRPAHFYIGPELHVAWRTGIVETIPWEIYQGRLLPPGQTRQRRTFRAWSLVPQGEAADENAVLLALKWDAERNEIHVVRGLECYVWEATGGTGNVVEGAETRRWLWELVGTIALADFTEEGELRDELICRLWQGVVGTSRLPLTSLEAPLPAYSLGHLAYVYRPGTENKEPLRNWRDLLEEIGTQPRALREQAKLAESVLRAAPEDEIAEIAARLAHRLDLDGLLRAMFNDVSLSPWTNFAEKALRLAEVHEPNAEGIGFLCWLIEKLGRHLTAYDLVTFHHRGANYPDALLLDLALKRLLRRAEREPDMFLADRHEWSAALPRRALRTAVHLRQMYEGHSVPDAPASPGENRRVLPAPHARVPEDQLVNPSKRRQKLFADDPLSRLWTPTTKQIFAQSLHDLAGFSHVVDLGKAIFIDRPFGLGKSALEPDQTPLLAHEAYSQALARRRMDALARLAREIGVALPQHWDSWRRALEEPTWVDGVPIQNCASLARPVAALTDALRASEDFIAVRTLASSMRLLLAAFDWEAVRARFDLESLGEPSAKLLCLRVPARQGSVMVIGDAGKAAAAPRLVFESDPSLGYRIRGGVELPVAGLRIWKVRDRFEREHDLRSEEVHVRPRWAGPGSS